MLYRVNAILEDLQYVSDRVARHNITNELTMITSARGAVFPEVMQWLRLGRMRNQSQVECSPLIDLKKKTEEFLKSQAEKINKLNISEEERQYYIAMGYLVPCRFSGDIKALVYLAELRSTRFVHPTLVEQILKMIASLKELFAKDGLVLHLDEEPNRFDIRRGEQDIVEK